MLAALAFLALAQDQPPIVPIDRPGVDGRGRDPWVFRCIFEDRARMVMLAPAPGWWIAFHPETGSLHKVWRGKMDFRGKVWDFSQDNSRAEGAVYFAAPNEIARLADGQSPPLGWTADRVAAETNGFRFLEAGARLTSPPIDAGGWRRVFLAFDETGRASRFRVRVRHAGDRPPPQWFDSATHSSSESDWQWNFKRIENPASDLIVEIESLGSGKRLRGLRLYGDRPVWFDGSGRELEVVWEGYRLIGRTQGAELRFALGPGGRTARIAYTVDRTSDGWAESWTISGLAAGKTLVCRRPGLSPGVRMESSWNGGSWKFDRNGAFWARFHVPEGRR